MSTLDNKELVRFVTEQGLNQGRVDFVDQVFARDYVVHAPDLPFSKGPAAFKAAVGLWRMAFPDFYMDITDMLSEGDKVVCQFRTTGTHLGPLMGMPPTGRRFVVEGADVHRVVGGRVVESWISDDIPRILMQLGMMARPAAVSVGE